MPADPFGERDLPVAVMASMAPAASGRADVTFTGLYDGGVQRTLATWVELVGERDRVLVSRSPHGRRAAVAVGRSVRTFDLVDGHTMSSKPIGHSEPSVIFGWTTDGIVVTRDTAARSGPDLPLEDGWVLQADAQIDHDDGFSGGHMSSFLLGGTEQALAQDSPAASDEPAVHAAPAVRATHRPAYRLSRGGADVELPPTPAGPGELVTLNWPPVVGPAGVLVRHSVDRTLSPTEAESLSGHPWLAHRDGTVTTLPIELGVSPVCALPDGRFLLPGASELWLDDAEEPMATISPDGTVSTLLVDGAELSPVRILDAVAPDLLDVIPFDAPEHRQWRDDNGLWVKAARVTPNGSTLTILLAERSWPADWHSPEAAHWLVASVPLDGSGPIELVARGHRAEGHHLTIAL